MMKCPRDSQLTTLAQFVRALSLLGSILSAFLLVFAGAAFAQDEDTEPPPAKAPSMQSAPDVLLPQITKAIQGVRTPDVAALAKALRVGEGPEGAVPGAPPNRLTPVGDLDGDGVPELLLKWAIPDETAGEEGAPAPDSQPLWGVYLLSWDGVRWKASRLVAAVEDFAPILIDLGAPVGRCIAVVIGEGDSEGAYPVIFQVKDHAATLLWDAQADDSRYQPLLQGRVSFQDRTNAPAEMIATGRADPGFLQVDPKGHRGFQARTVYHWDGKAFIPVKTEYFANQDYTVYRFISALHLHDFRSAYALVDPAKFLKSDAPTPDAFRHFIQDNWPEFLQDEVFVAPEQSESSQDAYLFVLPNETSLSVYHPAFSSDGKFLLTGLTRTREALP